ncbi:putative pE12 [Mycobacterium intracellulare 1956]|uniref:Putative pE12 n=1 Tax=Mycobacterium intracellulare 1956 TaxID=1299331 RepID=X8CVE7_MYCIT|nr:putative pE12 [Mycobacterium intracellulare 1956]
MKGKVQPFFTAADALNVSLRDKYRVGATGHVGVFVRGPVH